MPLGLVIISWIRTESTSHKSKISWDYMALKSFCTAKEALHSAKATYRMEENIFKPYI